MSLSCLRPVATAESFGSTLRGLSLTISVIGTGYLGVAHADYMTDLGHTVIAIDITKIESLSRAVPPIYEPGLDELLASVLPTGRLRFTTDYAEAACGRPLHLRWHSAAQGRARGRYVLSLRSRRAPSTVPEGLCPGGREVHGSGGDSGAAE